MNLKAYRADPDQFILTCGVSPALVLALASRFSPEDRIALARPGYVAYCNRLKARHMIPIAMPCGATTRCQLSAAALAALEPAPHGVIIASPANPTRTIIDAQELQLIANVCRERQICILSNEIYHGISYVEPPRSMLEFEPTSRLNRFSKYFSMMGWRQGSLLVPPEHLLSGARLGR